MTARRAGVNYGIIVPPAGEKGNRRREKSGNFCAGRNLSGRNPVYTDKWTQWKNGWKKIG